MTEKTQTVMITMDQHELACRLAEAIVQCKRPDGLTAAQALAEFDNDARQDFYRAASAAIKYFSECANNFGHAELIPPQPRKVQ